MCFGVYSLAGATHVHLIVWLLRVNLKKFFVFVFKKMPAHARRGNGAGGRRGRGRGGRRTRNQARRGGAIDDQMDVDIENQPPVGTVGNEEADVLRARVHELEQQLHNLDATDNVDQAVPVDPAIGVAAAEG